ncbi:MAG: hypothetical protein GY845_19830 [Planctomycetes bacterium]|nr:hypothetical protein [Planctomycetota bacterium]
MRKPEQKFSCGPISASIWANTKVVTGDTVKFYSVTINKAYKEGEDWKHTNSFDIEDLPKVALVANEAYKYIRLNPTDSNENHKK